LARDKQFAFTSVAMYCYRRAEIAVIKAAVTWLLILLLLHDVGLADATTNCARAD